MSNMLSVLVLVLNANYEPLNVCTTRRALGLMMAEKAILVQNGRGYIQGVTLQFPAPTIIRLSYMIRRPRPVVKLSKSEIFRRDKYTCQYCAKKSPSLTIDHIVPRSKNGKHSWDNLVAACPECNHRKGNRSKKQANMKLISRPKAPTASALYIFGKFIKSNQEWVPYIKGW